MKNIMTKPQIEENIAILTGHCGWDRPCCKAKLNETFGDRDANHINFIIRGMDEQRRYLFTDDFRIVTPNNPSYWKVASALQMTTDEVSYNRDDPLGEVTYILTGYTINEQADSPWAKLMLEAHGFDFGDGRWCSRLNAVMAGVGEPHVMTDDEEIQTWKIQHLPETEE